MRIGGVSQSVRSRVVAKNASGEVKSLVPDALLEAAPNAVSMSEAVTFVNSDLRQLRLREFKKVQERVEDLAHFQRMLLMNGGHVVEASPPENSVVSDPDLQKILDYTELRFLVAREQMRNQKELEEPIEGDDHKGG